MYISFRARDTYIWPDHRTTGYARSCMLSGYYIQLTSLMQNDTIYVTEQK